MPTRDEWITIIRGRKGKIAEHRHFKPTTKSGFANEFTWIEAYWVYSKPGDRKFMEVRDQTAREMRKDGWDVTSGTT
jgi:hypothetical protein